MREKLITGLLVGGIVGALASIVTYVRPNVLEGMEMLTYDYRVRAAANPANADPRIVMVDIDDRDIRWVQRYLTTSWPWRREYFGIAAKHLLESGARAVVFDFLFVDPGNSGVEDVEMFAKVLGSAPRTVIGLQLTRFEKVRSTHKGLVIHVNTYADCKKAGPAARTLLWWQARVFLVPDRAAGKKGACQLWMGGERTEAELRKRLSELKGQEAIAELLKKTGRIRTLTDKDLKFELTAERIAEQRGIVNLKVERSLKLPSYPYLIPPLIPLVVNTRLGVVTQDKDRDGLFRHYAPIMRHGGNVYASLSLSAAQVAFPGSKLRVKGRTLKFGKSHVDMDEDGRVALRFHGSGNAYSRVGIRHVLNTVNSRLKKEAYDSDRKNALTQLKARLADPKQIPEQMRSSLKSLLTSLEKKGCAVPLGKAYKSAKALVQAIGRAQPAALTDGARKLGAAAKARGIKACQADIKKGLAAINKLAKTLAEVQQKTQSALKQIGHLNSPDPCQKKLKSILADANRVLKEKGVKSAEFAKVAKALEDHLNSGPCQMALCDTLAKYLAHSDQNNPERFKRVKDIQPGSPKGRIFIIHAAAAGLRDLKPTPLDPNFRGAEVNATFLDNLLNSDFVRRTGRGMAALTCLLVCLLLGVGTFLLIGLLRSAVLAAVSSLVISALVTGGYGFLAYLFYKGSGVWLDVAGPVLGGLFTWGAAVATNIYQEGQSRRFVQDALGKYTSPVLVKELMNNPKALSLEWGEKRTLTVFFSDVVGFTSISERLSPEDLVVLLNDYLTNMTDIILAYEGIVDKYIGDAIMAFWGAPMDNPNHALDACKVGLLTSKRLKELQPKWKERFGELIQVRAGINSGDAVAGNMGSKHKYNYTLMGDVVNLAARLEGANKVYGTELMIADGTYQMVKDAVEVRELDFMTVKGKDKPVTVYELVGEKGGVDEPTTKKVERFHEALALYKDTRFEDALKLFEGLLETHPEDGPSKLYVERCKEYMENPPPEGWDGVFRMKTK